MPRKDIVKPHYLYRFNSSTIYGEFKQSVLHCSITICEFGQEDGCLGDRIGDCKYEKLRMY